MNERPGPCSSDEHSLCVPFAGREQPGHREGHKSHQETDKGNHKLCHSNRDLLNHLGESQKKKQATGNFSTRNL